MDCVDIKVGFACNNDCVHCVTADKRRFGELTREQIQGEIEYWARQVVADDGDPSAVVLVLTGGEPTIRPELPELIAYARGAGFERIELQTNARALSDAALAEAVAEAGLTSALVALHAPIAEVHDAITQRPGGFAETTAGMRHLINHGVEVRVNAVISRLNLEHLPALVPFLAEQFPEVRLTQLTFPHPNGNAETNFERVVPPLAETAEVVVQTLRRGLRRGIWLLVEAIPVCLLPGFEKHSIDLRELEVGGTDVGSGAPEGRVADYRTALQTEKRKGEQCAECSVTSICEGVWKEYADVFGTGELRPVSHLDPGYLMDVGMP